MSYSVSNLFKALAVNNKVPEGQLDNPDIPEFSQAGGVDVKFIRDQAYNALKLSSAPRNGDGYLLPRSTFSDNPKHDAFLLDGAIDPNVIRQRVNPISEGTPVTHEDALYGIDSTMTNSSDSVDLVQKARNGLYNYKNRFNAIPPVIPTDKSTVLRHNAATAGPSAWLNSGMSAQSATNKSNPDIYINPTKPKGGGPTGGNI
jgi:hypothetical protein